MSYLAYQLNNQTQGSILTVSKLTKPWYIVLLWLSLIWNIDTVQEDP